LFIIGSNLRREAPILAHRVRTAARRGARVAFLNPSRFTYYFPVAAYCESRSQHQVADLAAVLAAVAEGAGRSVPEPLAPAVRGAQVTADHRAIAAALGSGERKAIWLGALALRHPAYADLRALAAGIAAMTGATLGVLAEGANAAGAYLAGAVPHREAGGKPVPTPGWDAARMLREGLPAYLLFGGVEPWAEPASGAESLKCLAAAQLLIGMTPFASEPLKQIAHVLLPIGTFGEVSGTFVNLEGLWQSFSAAAHLVGEARPGWKVLRALGTELAVPGFGFETSEEVHDELKRGCADSAPRRFETAHRVELLASASASVTDLPMYQFDALVRRATSLQRTAEGRAMPATY
jgi:NADH-quinone oxidoreductase subunit G